MAGFVAELYRDERLLDHESSAPTINKLKRIVDEHNALVPEEERANAMKVYRRSVSGTKLGFHDYYRKSFRYRNLRARGWDTLYIEGEDDESFLASQRRRLALSEARREEARKFREEEDQKVLNRRVKPVLEEMLDSTNTRFSNRAATMVAHKLGIELDAKLEASEQVEG